MKMKIGKEAGSILLLAGVILQRLPGIPGMLQVGFNNDYINTYPMSLADLNSFISGYPGITALGSNANYQVHIAMFITWILIVVGSIVLVREYVVRDHARG
jgi:hypothetical protein